jgi:adenylylsulfate kinase
VINCNNFSIWLTGLPCSGKTTLADSLASYLNEKGILVKHFDGDEFRKGLSRDLGFSAGDRRENIRRAAEVNRLFMDSGFIAINSFICPLEEYRQMVRDIVGKNNCLEIFVDTPLEICEQRDAKGMFRRARMGEISDFTGVNAPFEIPANPDLIIQNGQQSFEEAKEILIKFVGRKIGMME